MTDVRSTANVNAVLSEFLGHEVSFGNDDAPGMDVDPAPEAVPQPPSMVQATGRALRPSDTPSSPKKRARLVITDYDSENDAPSPAPTKKPVAATTTSQASFFDDDEEVEDPRAVAKRKAAEARKRSQEEAKRAKVANAASQKRLDAEQKRREQVETARSLRGQALDLFETMYPLGGNPTRAAQQTTMAKATVHRDECLEGRMAHLHSGKGGDPPKSKLDEQVDTFLKDHKEKQVPNCLVSKRVLAIRRASATPRVLEIVSEREFLNNPTWLPPSVRRDQRGKVLHNTKNGSIRKKENDRGAYLDALRRTKDAEVQAVKTRLANLEMARRAASATNTAGI